MPWAFGGREGAISDVFGAVPARFSSWYIQIQIDTCGGEADPGGLGPYVAAWDSRHCDAFVSDGETLESTSQWLQEIVQSVLQKWQEAEGLELEVPQVPSWMHVEGQNQAGEAAIAKGRELFGSELTACSKCHGEHGQGDGKSQDYDEWTKDWTILAGIDPRERGAWKVMKPFGALKPVLVKPRNLQWGAFHGGGDPESIFRRIVLGIEGTPMPPVARALNGNPGLTDDEIWSLVGYVMYLSREHSSKPAGGVE